MLFSGPLLGAIHEIHENDERAWKMYAGNHQYLLSDRLPDYWTYTNMEMKAKRKSFIRLQLYTRLNGPLTAASSSWWNALLIASAVRDDGQTQKEG